MTAHTSGSFLHSCLRVPIDPCNNCPAPVYNRPKMYLGRLTTTPMSNTTKLATATTLKTTTNYYDMDSMLATSGIRSLAKLYDSIPDYCDINHLPSEEFYSTLDTLRTTCCELRTKPLDTCIPIGKSTTSSASSSSTVTEVKTKSKRSSSTGKKSYRKKSAQKSKKHDCVKERCITATPCDLSHKVELVKRTRLKSFREDFEDEVKAFKKTLQDYEDELKKRAASVTAASPNSTKPKVNTNFSRGEILKTNNEKQPQKANTLHSREYLKKSYSFNDIRSIADSKDSNYPSSKPQLKTSPLIKRGFSKVSNYFAIKENSNSTSPEDGAPKITLESPSTENQSTKTSSPASGGVRKKKSKHSKQQDQFKVPFTLFNLTTKSDSNKLSTPSPQHPVARPNLAATLRAEVSKKKLKELQNNCTYYDTTPQFDWEVRKTPAWKSLSLNESHKEIIALRLATRKAEQALQKREYERNMELMRQRVKSAPLLLEGTTFWGPNVGKLTHNCHQEGTKHLCHSIQRRTRSKSAGGCSRTEAREENISECSQRSNRINSLRKLYGGSAKAQSRNSQSLPSRKTSQSNRLQVPTEVLDNSGDELSSLDRAFL